MDAPYDDVFAGNHDVVFHQREEEWMAGDFYNIPDDVTRGVSLAPAQFGDATADENIKSGCGVFGESQVGFGIDGYSDEGWKGSTGFDEVAVFSQPEWGQDQALLGVNHFEKTDPFSTNMFFTDRSSDSSHLRFPEDHSAAAKPKDALFEYSSTTIFLSSDTPGVIGNRVLDLFCNRFTAQILKVNLEKSVVKVSLSVAGVTCVLKARIYADCNNELTTHALEFQRRSGDTLIFHDVYRCVSDCMKLEFGAAGPAVESSIQTFGSELRLFPEVPAGNVPTGDIMPMLPSSLLASAMAWTAALPGDAARAF